MKEYDEKTIEELIDGKLPWQRLKEIITSEKDRKRFFIVREILQRRVKFPEKIILPLSFHLFIVDKNGERVIKCDCGFEFGDYRKNWKEKARVYIRDTMDKFLEIFPEFMTPDPDWVEIREYYCPSCFTLLEVEALPPGYPPIFEFLPDLDALEEWLKEISD